MDLLLDARFWLTALAAWLVLLVDLPLRPTIRFALVNLAAIAWLLGWPAAAALAGLAGALWLALRWLGWAGTGPAGTVGFGLALAALVALFVLHKFNLQHSPILNPLRRSWGTIDPALLNVLVALSYSFVFVRAIDALRAVARDRAALLDPLSMIGYLAPFHMLVAGPITPYRDYLAMNDQSPPVPRFAPMLADVNLIVTGLLYKLVLAEAMRIFAFGLGGRVSVHTWAESAYALVYIFFDFAGYSMVALGIGRLLNVPTPRNFRHPLLASSITDFWTRWHISLGDFVRRNIFLPMQLALVRRTRGRHASAIGLGTLVVSFVFVALWHNLGWRILLWALLTGAIMAGEKLIRDRSYRAGWGARPIVQRAAKLLGPIYVFAVISASFRLIAGELLGT